MGFPKVKGQKVIQQLINFKNAYFKHFIEKVNNLQTLRKNLYAVPHCIYVSTLTLRNNLLIKMAEKCILEFNRC